MKLHAIKYPVFSGTRSLHQLNEFMALNYSRNKLFILVDEHTHEFCFPELVQQVTSLKKAVILKIESGEINKNLTVCSKLWESLLEHGADRFSLLINLGGGVIGDLGGFAASTYMRGIDFIQVPTTLLAQADASLGGKSGVNFSRHKNLIGVFNDPKAVVIYPSFLKTLDGRQFLSGFAEMLKHGLIANRSYWDRIKSMKVDHRNFDEEVWTSIISKSVEIKNQLVIADPKDEGSRKKLNFGHTIGHAIESHFLEEKVTLLHGEAIAAGMLCEAYLSYRSGRLSKKSLDEIIKSITSLYHPLDYAEKDMFKMLKFMQSDKKNKTGKINCTLLKEIGEAEIDHYCTAEQIRESLEYYSGIN